MKVLRYLAAITIFGLVPKFSFAHGIGEVYALPIPLKYYLGAAGLAVALSFFIFAYVLGTNNNLHPRKEKMFRAGWFLPLIQLFRFLLLFFVILSVVAGILGNPNSAYNFAPYFFWIGLILGFAVLSLIFGNIWDKLNPFKTLVKFINLGTGQKEISGWVGVVLLFGLYWLELASRKSFVPMVIGMTLLFYIIVNIWANYFYKNWFRDGETFSVLFGFIGQLAPFWIGDDNRSIIYSPPTERLDGRPYKSYMLGVAAIVLAATSFDSFKETILWVRIWNFFAVAKNFNLVLIDTLGLLISVLPFILIYLFIMWLIQKIVHVLDWRDLSNRFVIILVPIGFGYMMAHYFSLMIVTTPNLLGLALDPFGLGWNLFSSSYLLSSNVILGAKFIWFVEIGFVVAAHIVGTLYAHILAVRIMPDPKKVLISQYPMLILMVLFTVGTLWLLSQPLVIQK